MEKDQKSDPLDAPFEFRLAALVHQKGFWDFESLPPKPKTVAKKRKRPQGVRPLYPQ